MGRNLVNATHLVVQQGDTIKLNFPIRDGYGEPEDMMAILSKSTYHGHLHQGKQLSLGELGLYDREVKLSLAGKNMAVGWLDTSGMDLGTWRVQLNLVFGNLTSIGHGGYLEVTRGSV
jgi:hypothetical protein